MGYNKPAGDNTANAIPLRSNNSDLLLQTEDFHEPSHDKTGDHTASALNAGESVPRAG
jgi:hypothetical protein